jgi:phosphate-selective porin OprO/OprP
LLSFCLWSQAEAQTVPPPGPPADTVPAFVIQSDNGDNRLQVGALVQFDGRFTVDDPRQDVTDTFVIRRVRPIFQGRVARYFDYHFLLDFAAVPYVRDAYLETRLATAFRVRAGKGKTPFGLERLHSANVLLFVERAFPTELGPDRDIGVQLLGDLAGGRVSYAGAVMNGTVDGSSVDIDTNEGKDLIGRIMVSPWVADHQHPLAGLGVGIAGTSGEAPAPLPVFRSAGQQIFFAYAGGAIGDDRRSRVSPQAFYYRGPFGGFAEYVHSAATVRQGSVAGEIGHTAWQVAGSWVLTEEQATARGVRPRASFDPEHHTFGAVQLAARYHALSVEQDAFTYALAAPGASRTAAAFTVGVNWYLNQNIKWVFNVERTIFDGDADAPRPAENAVLFRGQLSF